MSFVATAIIGAGVVGGVATAYAANKASTAQQNAASQAANIEQQQLDYTKQINQQNQNNLAPYIAAGTGAQTTLTNELPQLTSPVVMNEAALQQTPGYQFNLTQGLKAVQNSAAARGLGVSGAALKGASTFATGLADSTYQNQFANAVTNQSNAYNRLLGVVQTGEQAGGALAGATTQGAAVGTQGAASIGASTIAGGNAAAAGYNALGTATTNATNNIAGYAIAKGLYGIGNTPVGTANGLT